MPDSTTFYTSCLRIQRTDGYVLCLTDLDINIQIDDSLIGLTGGNQTYLAAAGYTPTNVQSTSDNAVNNADIEGVLTSVGVEREDIIGGRYDFARLHVFIWDWKNNVLVKKLASGHWGEATIKDGSYVAEFRSLTQQLQQTIGRTYGPECDEQLGGPRCKITLGPFIKENGNYTGLTPSINKIEDSSLGAGHIGSYATMTSGANTGETQLIIGSGVGYIDTNDFTNNNVTGDTYVIKNLPGDVHAITGTVDSLTDNSKFISTTLTDGPHATDYFAYGKLTFTSGENDGIHMEVKSYDSVTGEFILFLPMSFNIQVGDTFAVFAGCDKRLETCKLKFFNNINHQGFPYIPGNDEVGKFGGQ